MIIPFLDGFLTFTRAPITWMLILLNCFLFSQNYSLSQECQREFDAWYEDDDFLYTQGQIYQQFNRDRDVAQVKNFEVLGRLAFTDEDFMNRAPKIKWRGDQVAIGLWREQVRDFMVVRAYYPPLIFGVSKSQKDFFSTISYQFYHEGFMHLAGNILLILIVGGYLERRYNGLLVFATYLIGGSLAALLFSFTVGLSGAPLVGASGSLCALLGLLLSLEFNEKTRLFYMILPSSKYMGFVLVPTIYWVILLCMIEDVSGLISQPGLLTTGVAYAVHLCGFFIGAAGGIFLKPLFKRKSDEDLEIIPAFMKQKAPNQ